VEHEVSSLEVLVNISQMTVSQVSLASRTDSPQQRQPDRYDRLTHDVETITGKPASGVREFLVDHPDPFGSPTSG
jgi:hypothetical protein